MDAQAFLVPAHHLTITQTVLVQRQIVHEYAVDILSCATVGEGVICGSYGLRSRRGLAD
jgi:hypothetical protein